MQINKITADMGMQYWYPAPPIVLPAGTAPAAPNNYLGVPGNPVTTEFQIINNDYVGVDLICPSAESMPFLVNLQVGYVSLMGINGNNSATQAFQGAHSATVFGLSAGQPNRLFIPFDAPLNYNIKFTLQDINYVANVNLVYITIQGVQKYQKG